MSRQQPVMFLVTGAPRSGTTFLQNTLNSHPSIACFHEFELSRLHRIIEEIFWADASITKLVADIEQRASEAPPKAPVDYENLGLQNFSDYERVNTAREQSISKLIGTSTLRPLRALHRTKIVESIFSIVSGKSGLRAIGDKQPNLRSAEIGILREYFPGLKVIYVVRNPFDVIASSMRRAAATKVQRDSWHIESIDQAIEEWVLNWEHLASEYSRRDAESLVLRYEDLLNDFSASTEALAAFLSAPAAGFQDLGQPFAEKDKGYALSEEQKLAIRSRIGDLGDVWSTAPFGELLSGYRSLPPIVERGDIFHPKSGNRAVSIFRSGFSIIESWGVWTDGGDASILFRPAGGAEGGRFDIRLTLARYDRKPGDLEFEVTASGIPRQKVSIPRSAPLELALTSTLTDGAIRIDIHIPNPKGPGEEPVGDTRRLGLGISRIELEAAAP